MEYKKEAKVFCKAIQLLAENPARLENLENYLSYHFVEWLEEWANTPQKIAGEMVEFSKIEV